MLFIVERRICLPQNGELEYDAEAKGTATLVELLGELH